jgi:hypothetical protein
MTIAASGRKRLACHRGCKLEPTLSFHVRILRQKALPVRQSEFSNHCARNIATFVEIEGFLGGLGDQLPLTLFYEGSWPAPPSVSGYRSQSLNGAQAGICGERI